MKHKRKKHYTKNNENSNIEEDIVIKVLDAGIDINELTEAMQGAGFSYILDCCTCLTCVWKSGNATL